MSVYMLLVVVSLSLRTAAAASGAVPETFRHFRSAEDEVIHGDVTALSGLRSSVGCVCRSEAGEGVGVDAFVKENARFSWIRKWASSEAELLW